MDWRIEKMADVLINYSTQVKPGERVLIRGKSPSAQPLMQALTISTLKAGGLPFNFLHVSDEDATMLRHASEAQLEAVNPMLKLMYETSDVIIRIEADENTRATTGFSPDKLKAVQRNQGNSWLSIQMAREAAGTLRRCTTLFPTQALAQDADMSLAAYEDFVYGACALAEGDPVTYWGKTAAEQQRLIDYLNGKKQMQVHGTNIDLTLSIQGRRFMNADGKFNFPDGEIFTGPVETSVNGWVRFTFPLVYHGSMVRGAELVFKDGKAVEAKAEHNAEYLNSMLDTDPGARYLGEFAIGTNRFIDRFTGNILFDEKIGGTVHMALGQSYVQTGGVNKSAVHWDMICDTRTDSEILVDGERFFANGQFLV
ncbi:MAG: aminopeptidase [Aggregatilineales bacterium]